MMEEFKQYIISLYQDIPQEVYEGLLSVFCLGLVVFVAWKGLKTGFRYSANLLLVEYVFLMRGFSEVDDVMHNMVGCVIRYGVYLIGRYGYERLSTWSIYNI